MKVGGKHPAHRAAAEEFAAAVTAARDHAQREDESRRLIERGVRTPDLDRAAEALAELRDLSGQADRSAAAAFWARVEVGRLAARWKFDVPADLREPSPPSVPRAVVLDALAEDDELRASTCRCCARKRALLAELEGRR